MAAFKVFIRRTGGVPVEVDVTPETTMHQIKVSHDLVGYTMTFRGNRRGADTVAAIGIQVGETISVVKTGLTPEKKSAWRLGRGDIHTSTAHDLAHLHARTEATVVGAVMEESELTRANATEQSASLHKGDWQPGCHSSW